MRERLLKGIVRILSPAGATAGTGFVVSSDGLIITCAHVLDNVGYKPGSTVRIEFHSAAPTEPNKFSDAIVESKYWKSPDFEDVAFLRFDPSVPDGSGETGAIEADDPPISIALPQGVERLQLAGPTPNPGGKYRTFGFPQSKPEEGMWGSCEVVGATSENGFPVLQLRSPEVTRGFSGAPLWDDARKRVVGMVVSITRPDKDSRGRETAFIIPTETLRSICPILDSPVQENSDESERLTKQAERHIEESDFPKAIECLGRALELDPENQEARSLLTTAREMEECFQRELSGAMRLLVSPSDDDHERGSARLEDIIKKYRHHPEIPDVRVRLHQLLATRQVQRGETQRVGPSKVRTLWPIALALVAASFLAVFTMFVVVPKEQKVDFQVEPKVVRVGDEVSITILVDGRAVSSEYQCEILENGKRVYFGKAPSPPYRPGPVLFPLGEREKQVSLTVRLLDTRNREVHKKTETLLVRFEPTLSLTADRTNLFEGERTKISLVVRPILPGEGHVFQWQAEQGEPSSSETSQPQVEYKAPVKLPEGEPRKYIKISVVVLDKDKREVGRSSLTVTVSRAPPTLFMFVLDATARMGEPPGKSPLDVALSDLRTRLARIEPRGGHVGIEVFGRERAPKPADPCENSEELMKLAPLDVAGISKKILEIRPGQREAPLILSLRRAVGNLARYPINGNAQRYLVTIVGGPDTCLVKDGDPKRTALEVQRVLADTGLRELYLEYRLLDLTVGVTYSGDATETWLKDMAKSSDQGEFPRFFLMARSPEQLQAFLSIVVQLGAGSMEERVRAFDYLEKELFLLQQVHDNKRHSEMLRRYKERLQAPK